MANVVVTGASGFLGSHIADALSESGHDVTLVDLVESPFRRQDQKMLLGNITDSEFIFRGFKKC